MYINSVNPAQDELLLQLVQPPYLNKKESFKKLLVACFFALAGLQLSAQLCQGSLGDPVIKTTFGSGANPGPALNAATTNYQYVNFDCPDDGRYSVRNSTVSCFGSTWHSVTADHTGDANGYFMVVNASTLPGDFYVDTVRSLCSNTTFEFSAWIMNVLKLGVCGASIEPNITFIIEKLDGTVLQQHNTGSIGVSSVAEWKQYGFFFSLPAGVNDLIIRMKNNAPGGCGNDLLLDDITFRPCGPQIPVTLDGSNEVNKDLCQGKGGQFTFLGTVPPGYAQPIVQWQESTNNGVNWTDIAGATSTTFIKTFLPNSAIGVYNYRMTLVEASNSNISSCRIASPMLSVSINGNPIATAINDGPVCEGSNINLSASGGTNYTWSGINNFAATGANISIPNAKVEQRGMYYVEVKDALGCTDVDSTIVEVIAAPIIDLAFTDTTICEGSSIMLLSGGGTSYSWFPATSLSSVNIANPVANPIQSLEYKVTVANGNCTNSGLVKVNVLKKPVANAGTDKIIIEGQSTILNGSVAGENVNHTWSPDANMNDASLLEPVVSPVADATYILRVTSNNGCGTSSDSVKVRVYQNLKIPNAFSPNGDGIHDKWVIEALEAYPNFELTIFNRYGQKIYLANKNTQPWNGTLNNKPVPIGTYYFILDLKEGGLKRSGFVDIIR